MMKTMQTKSHANETHHAVLNSAKESFFSGDIAAKDSFFSPAFIQPKLKIGAPGNKYEQQSDRVSDTNSLFEPSVMTSVQETTSEPMIMGDWKAWIGNGEVINNSSRAVTVWSSDDGTYTIPAHSRSARWGEDVDHIRDIHGQWWKIGWNTAVVDANGEVSGAKCRSPGRGHDCGQLGDYPPPRQEDQIYAKLKVNQPNDLFEQEADAMAEKVVNGEAPIQRKCADCEEEELYQKKADSPVNSNNIANEGISHKLYSNNGLGSRLSSSVLSEMNHKMGANFSNVKIHTNSEAIQMNQTLGARAFTHGTDIYFNSGEYNPSTSDGKHLLAHELTHVIQQNSSQVLHGVQRKVVDDDVHVPCRNNRAGSVATLRTAEQDAVALARRTAAKIRIHLILHPLIGLAGETQALHDFRDALWRRFHFDYNNDTVRNTLLPIFARRYELVADWISNLDHRYICAGPGNEPPGECTDQPGAGMAWTATGINETELCESFWNAPADDRAETILHEWLHFGFGWLHDCEETHNRNNTVCWDMFAGELAGTATPADYENCCEPPADPLPPLQGIP